jgi:hypothetical protein
MLAHQVLRRPLESAGLSITAVLRTGPFRFPVQCSLLVQRSVRQPHNGGRFGGWRTTKRIRRFDTSDACRNNWLIASLVLGEGWHNNHHRYPNCAQAGIGRHELDPTWLGKRALAALKLASRLHKVPDQPSGAR